MTKVTNFIDPSVKKGSNVKVWHFAYVGANTRVGNNVKIGSLAHVDYGVEIGNDTKIEGSAYIPPLSVIGNRVFIGPGVTLTNDVYPMSPKMLGVTIEDNAIICAKAVLRAGITIHKNAVVAMGAVVTRDVAPNAVVMGVPAKYVYSRQEYERKKLAWESSVG